jgi:hypothetical protein
MGRPVKETDVMTWNGTAWERCDKGEIYGAGAAAGAVTQTGNTGVGFTVSRDKASANTDDVLMLVNNDNAGDDQAALKVKQDAPTDAFQVYDGAAKTFSIGDGGTALLTTAATTGFAAHIDGSTITTGDVLKLTVNDTPLNGGKYIKCIDNGSTVDFSVGEAGAVAVGGTLAVGGASTLTGAVTAAGAITAAGAVTGLRRMNTDISGASATLAVATTPSGSVCTVSAAECAVTLPALTAGCTYTFIMLGATSFTLTGPSACVLCDGTAAAKTNFVWSTTPQNLCVTVISTASNWVVTSFTAAPDSSS